MATLHVVTGPPCSGKSTYVDAHAGPGEVRIDLDRIAVALGSEVEHGSDGGIRSAAMSARQAAIDRCIEDGIPAWVIHGDPSQEQVAAYEDAGAEFVAMDADEGTCLSRAESDGRPQGTSDLIREWFDRNERSKEAAMPYLPEQRQYRTFAAANFQPIADRLPDAPADGECPECEPAPSFRVRGYFTTFDDEYMLYPAVPSAGWPATYEQIDRHAFDECDLSDVIVQYDHCGDVLARTRNGSLKLGFDDHGGYCEMTLDGCQRARDMYESICNGLVVEMSFGFVIADDEDGVGYVETRDEQGSYHVTVTRVRKIFDVSCVSIPANPGTDVESIRKRSYIASIIEADMRAEQEAARAAEDAEMRATEEKARARRARRARALRLASTY